MTRTLLLSTLLLALTWLHGAVGAGFGWDALNGLGFIAIGAMGALHLERFQPSTQATTPIPQRLARHARLGQLALVIATLHAVGLLLLDPVLVEYLKPTAPLYMLAGIVALPVLGIMVWGATTPYRRRWHGTLRRFRMAHRVLGAAALAMVGWHVIGSAFYLDHPILAFVFAGLLVSWLAAPGMVVTVIERTRVDVDDRRAAALLLVALTVHATARNL